MSPAPNRPRFRRGITLLTSSSTTTDANTAHPAREALRLRRSHSKVTEEAPSHEQVAELIEVLASVADHSALRPWRVIEIRGKARTAVGRSLAEASGNDPETMIAKAHRASLLLAVVVTPRESEKVPLWEQEAVATGVAHNLGLLLHEAGWGTIWRSGLHTRSAPVHRAHQLSPDEYLLGWIYVGGIPERDQKPKPRRPIDLAQHLSQLTPASE